MWRFLIVLAFSSGLVAATAVTTRAEPPGSQSPEEALRDLARARGLAPTPLPPESPEALRALGGALFFDPALSGEGRHACAFCHSKLTHYGHSIGINGSTTEVILPRSPPAMVNLHVYGDAFFHDARVEVTPEGVSAPADLPEPDLPIEVAVFLFAGWGANEMIGAPVPGNALHEAWESSFEDLWVAIADQLLASGYEDMVRDAFPEKEPETFTFTDASRAMLAWSVEHFASTDSPWDRWLAGDADAISDRAKRGALLFYGEARCSTCHDGPLFDDEATYNLLVPQFGPAYDSMAPTDLGRAGVTGLASDRYRFRVPTLRNLTFAFPFMHNGAYPHLEDAVRHHLDPVAAMDAWDPSLAPPMHQPDLGLWVSLVEDYQLTESYRSSLLRTSDAEVTRPARPLTDREIDQILAFLDALSDRHTLESLGNAVTEVPDGRATSL